MHPCKSSCFEDLALAKELGSHLGLPTPSLSYGMLWLPFWQLADPGLPIPFVQPCRVDNPMLDSYDIPRCGHNSAKTNAGFLIWRQYFKWILKRNVEKLFFSLDSQQVPGFLIPGPSATPMADQKNHPLLHQRLRHLKLLPWLELHKGGLDVDTLGVKLHWTRRSPPLCR